MTHIDRTSGNDESPTIAARSRSEFRQWLLLHAQNATECWLELRRGQPKADGSFYYLDAVEEALCFGWIDSTQKKVDGRLLQRFSPRQPKSAWSELNKERVRRLERLGLMTDSGRRVLPDMDPAHFVVDPDLKAALEAADAWETFCRFPTLYQRVRAYNVAFYKKRSPSTYRNALSHLVSATRDGILFGQWDDYGRLGHDAAQEERK
ncbi:MAG: YdeI/OmpD-associated family protein [Bacteroidales bacterium]|nr:YdeI/OmpD-associated family protein [Bacteroidales bacterium]